MESLGVLVWEVFILFHNFFGWKVCSRFEVPLSELLYWSVLSSALLPVDGFRLVSTHYWQSCWRECLIVDHQGHDIQKLGGCHEFYISYFKYEWESIPETTFSEVGSSPCIGVGTSLFRFESLHSAEKRVLTVLRCAGLAKQARPGKESSLWPTVISHFPEDTLVCPVLCLKSYEKATAVFRGKGNLQHFLAINSLHGPVTTSTIDG